MLTRTPYGLILQPSRSCERLISRWLIYQAVNVTIPVLGEESHYGGQASSFFPLFFRFYLRARYPRIRKAPAHYCARSIGTNTSKY